MHDGLPTLLSLKNRGIPTQSTCPLCNDGLPTDLANVSMQQWVGNLLDRHKKLEAESIIYLQAIFTTLWTIWNHRNTVVHEGKQPNPMEVILTA